MIGTKTRGSMFRSALIGIALLWLLDPAARADEFDREVRFSIAPQSLASAVMDFAEQSKIQVVTSSTELERYQSQGVSGRYAVRTALTALLDGTGLAFREVVRGTVSIGKAEPVGKVDGSEVADGIRLAQADSSLFPQEEGVPKENKQDKLEEVVVTAQKREERLQDVPMSISVLTEDSISLKSLVKANDFLKYVPGVEYQDRGADATNPNVIRIRGINGGVGAYLGEIPLNTA